MIDFAENLDFEGIEFLLSRGGNFKECNNKVLGVFISKGSLQGVKYLVNKGANIDVLEETPYGHPIQTAISCNNIYILDWLFKNAKNSNKEYFLEHAVERRSLQSIIYLVNHGVKFDSDHLKYLRYPAIRGEFELFKCLHQVGLDIHCKNDYPLKLAVEDGHQDIVNYIKQH